MKSSRILASTVALALLLVAALHHPVAAARGSFETFGGRLSIDVATMANFDDDDDEIRILNLVQDSVIPLSKAVLIVA